MRSLPLALITAIVLVACDENRIYEKNIDFEQRFWNVEQLPEYEFEIQNNTIRYNLYCDVRNSVSYEWSRLFLNYYLMDSTGKVIESNLAELMLFDPKTGKPYGNSGLGDIYDHRLKVVSNFKFPYNGKFKMKFKQEMRKDSLDGILAVGLRVEKAQIAIAGSPGKK
jgi:gliding motility-associated lipoprotein GldH